MAAPVIESTAQNDSGGITATTLAINVPVGTVDDNLLLVVGGSDDNTAASPDEWLDETGWTKPIMIGDTTVDAKLVMYWRVASSEPASYTFDHGSSDELWGIMFRISGVNTANPINIVGVATLDGGGTNRDALSIITTVDDCLAFYAVAFDGGDGTPFGEPTGWTEHSEHNSGTGSTDACGVVGTKTQATAGATGTASISSAASDGSVAIQFAVEPAGVPGAGLRQTLTLLGIA